MRKKLIVANWKSNKNPSMAKDWLDELKLKTEYLKLNTDNFEVVICPPYIDLPILKNSLTLLSPAEPGLAPQGFKFSVTLSCQDVSPFPDGSYTGAVSVNQIKDLISYALIGHSERRKYFSETTESVGKKVDLLIAGGIKPIICAQDEKDIPENVKNYKTDQIVIMFEPASAISQNGVFKAEDPACVKETIARWKTTIGDYQYLYGGSVNPENAKSLLDSGAEGFVSGKASLETDSFLGILQNV